MTSLNVTRSKAPTTVTTKISPVVNFFSFTNIFTLAVLAFVALGWRLRDEYLVNPEFGLGYALGITGGVMMLLLLLYPLRKRFNRNAFFVLSTKNWFKLHMIFGVLGPLLILYHCNFKLGSANSNIALLAMGLMVGSGLIGRYIYGKIHASLFGKKLEVKDLLKQLSNIKQQLDNDTKIDSFSLDTLYELGDQVSTQTGFLANFISIITLTVRSRRAQSSVIKELRLHCTSKSHLVGFNSERRKNYFYTTRTHVQAYIRNIRTIARLSFYERLFSMWHLLHLPIFFMLIVTALIHVYAVHVY